MNGSALGREVVRRNMAPASARRERVAGSWAARLVRELAIHDWFVMGYLTVLTVAVVVQPPSPTRTGCLLRIGAMLLFSIAGIVAVRGRLLQRAFFPPLLYRLAVYGTVQVSYFELRELLPLVNHGALDAQLFRIDEQLLHWEPSLTFDELVSPATTEWFAFFYFGYFALLASHVLPLVFFSRHKHRLSQFALGMILVYATAHMLYMVVPGYGPVRYLKDRYTHPLPHGMWFDAVLDAVQSGGAQKDIFPSLHTAGPVFLSLFSYHYRRERPFTYTWPLVAFFSANIVIATLFLRWHYLIDVLAGMLLALVGFVVAMRLSAREVRRRERAGLGPVWMPIAWPWLRDRQGPGRP